MTDVLKNEGNFWLASLRTQQVVVIILELRVREMIPAAIPVISQF